MEMKALVYHGPGERGWDSVEDPGIVDPTDIIVRVDTTTICGTDLHILKGDVPETTPGTILGHEAVGTVQEVGAGVTTVAIGDRVLLSCVSACGRCRYCKEGRYGQCLGGGGWIFGHTINGVQAEYARVPFADNSVYKIPDGLSDEQVLFLADILPTSYEVGVLNGMVTPGDVVAIVGAGPIGLAAILTAKLFTPGKVVAIDIADSRLEGALRFGADVVINNSIRACDRADPAGGPRCQHRRSRQAGHATPREAVDPRCHGDHGTGRHVQHRSAHEADRQRSA
jgi:alcohol dehydrogenase